MEIENLYSKIYSAPKKEKFIHLIVNCIDYKSNTVLATGLVGHDQHLPSEFEHILNSAITLNKLNTKYVKLGYTNISDIQDIEDIIESHQSKNQLDEFDDFTIFINGSKFSHQSSDHENKNEWLPMDDSFCVVITQNYHVERYAQAEELWRKDMNKIIDDFYTCVKNHFNLKDKELSWLSDNIGGSVDVLNLQQTLDRKHMAIKDYVEATK